MLGLVKNIIFSVLLILLSFSAAKAQRYKPEYNFNSELWLTTEAQYKFENKSRFKFQHQLRINEGGLDRTIHQVIYSHPLWRNFDAAYGIRLIQNIEENELELEDLACRIQADISHEVNWKRWQWQNRLRFQISDKFKNLDDEAFYPTNDIRLKTEIAYQPAKSKLTPYVGMEIFNHDEHQDLDGFTKYRWLLGANYRLKKAHRFQFQFFQELETRIWKPKATNVLRIKYSCRI